MYAEDTIVAIATPPGRGGIGVIRISGHHAGAVATEVFRLQRPTAHPESHRFYLGAIVDADGKSMDQALAVFMYAPHSYTGEDVVELHCHGSPVLLHLILARCCEAGARTAEPGEFTKRAFLNGRIDLVQAEAVAEIVEARTEAAARTGLRHLSGALSERLSHLCQALVEIKAQMEVLIDFSEEEVDLAPASLLDGLDAIATQVEALIGSYRVGRLLRHGFHLAIVGQPNVGKSSLLNALAGSERAIVTQIPGTTRDIIEEGVDIGGVPVVLSDTAGWRESEEVVERIGVERARRRAAEADGVLIVLDRSRPLSSEDRAIIHTLRPQPGVIVINKCDLPAAWDTSALPFPAHRPTVEVSASTSAGIDDLRTTVKQVLLSAPADPEASLVTLARHRDALDKAGAAIRSAHRGLSQGDPVDVIAADVQSAIDHVGGITGAVSTEDVLDRIFRDFCIGK